MGILGTGRAFPMVVKRWKSFKRLPLGTLRVRYSDPTSRGEAIVDTVTPNGLRLICPPGTRLTGLVEVETMPGELQEISQVGRITWGPKSGPDGVEYGLEFIARSTFLDCVLKPWHWPSDLAEPKGWVPATGTREGSEQSKLPRERTTLPAPTGHPEPRPVLG